MAHPEPRTERRRALIVFALGPEAATDLIQYATELYGDDAFAVDYVHRTIGRWVARELGHDLDQVRALSRLVVDLSDRASAYEAELRAIHAAEELRARRSGKL